METMLYQDLQSPFTPDSRYTARRYPKDTSAMRRLKWTRLPGYSFALLDKILDERLFTIGYARIMLNVYIAKT